MKLYKFSCLLLIVFTLFSCAGRLDGSLSADGSAVLSINTSLEPGITRLIRSFANIAGRADAPVLDAPAIAKTMSGAPGVKTVSLNNIEPSSVEGKITVSNIGDFLSFADSSGNGRFIFFEQGSPGRWEINLNRANGPKIVELLSAEAAGYLNALMAPIATGEDLTKTEYLELISSFYNKTISSEIANARIRVFINFPGAVTGIKGGTFSGTEASFDIPLLDLLVLETPISYEVRWR